MRVWSFWLSADYPPVLNGAPISTFDLDVVHRLGQGLGYEELLPRSTEVLIAAELRARVLNLEALIELKEQLGWEKDRPRLTGQAHTRLSALRLAISEVRRTARR